MMWGGWGGETDMRKCWIMTQKMMQGDKTTKVALGRQHTQTHHIIAK